MSAPPPAPPAPDAHGDAARRADAVATFRAVTAVASDDQASRMLAHAGWDLERAVDAFLSTGGGTGTGVFGSGGGGGSGSANDPPSHPDHQHDHRRHNDQDNHDNNEHGRNRDNRRRQSDTRNNSHSSNPHAAVSRTTRGTAAGEATEPAPASSRSPPRSPATPRWLLALAAPFRFVWSAVMRIADTVLAVLGGSARAIDVAPGNTPARRFRAFFEAHHGTQHPAFFDGSYLGALAAAQAQLKFLLVYLHSEEHGLTREFCTRVLAHPDVVRAANDGFVVWAGSVTQRDGAAAQYALRVSGFPFIGVVTPPRATVRVPSAHAGAVPDSGRSHVHHAVSSHQYGALLACRVGPGTLVGTGSGGAADTSGSGGAREHALQPNGTASPLPGGGAAVADTASRSSDTAAAGTVAWLAAVQRENFGLLDQVRRERDQRDSARLLRQEQDREFARSLEEDRARERAREEAEERARADAARIHDREIRRERKRASMPDEPDKGPGVASLVLRLPSGERASRRFDKDAPLEQVFDWAEVNLVDIELACLVSSYPRKIFQYPEDAHLTLQEAGFFPSAMLLLEERPDDGI
jgi:hypothetical protein